MKITNGWRWIWIGLLGLACTIAFIGCSDDNDAADDEALAAETSGDAADAGGGNGTSTNAPNSPPVITLNTNILGHLNPDLFLPLHSSVLLDQTVIIESTSSITKVTKPTPGAGKLTVTAIWEGLDLMGNFPINLPLQIFVNEGGPGGSTQYGGTSWWSGSITVPANLACNITIDNEETQSRATVKLTAVWTPK